MRDAAARFAADEVMPRIAASDADGRVEPELIRGLFDGGFMGVEITDEYGGSGSSFTAAWDRQRYSPPAIRRLDVATGPPGARDICPAPLALIYAAVS